MCCIVRRCMPAASCPWHDTATLTVAQAPIGPFDVGGANYGSGPKAFWPGSGSYSTFGLYSNSNAEVTVPPCGSPV